MSTGLFFLLCFIVGCLGGGAFREVMLPEDLSTWLLYGLMFLVGVGMGGRKGLSDLWRSLRPSALLLPWSSLAFTLLFSAVVVCFLPGLRVWDGLAVSSGMGYYTLSSVLITHLKTPVCGAEVAAALGVTALLCNVFRELIAIVAAPWLARRFGPLAPIAAAGSTSMDVSLPFIVRASGPSYVPVALLHGMTIDCTIPFLIPFLAGG